MLPQDWADELVRDGTPEVVTVVRCGRLAVVLAKFTQSPAHPPQSLWISPWLWQLRRRHKRDVRFGVWEGYNLATTPVNHLQNGTSIIE